jgi:hypothetical protein
LYLPTTNSHFPPSLNFYFISMQMSSQIDPENQSQQQPQSQKTNVSSQPDPVEAEHVRAVLAHITNNTAAPSQQQQLVPGEKFASKKAAAAAAVPPKLDSTNKQHQQQPLVAKKAESPAPQKKQQQQQPAAAPSKAAVENLKAAAPPAPVVAPSSSRPATRAMDKNTYRTTRVAAAPASTRAREPPRVRAPITKKAAPAPAKKQQQQQRAKPQITVAKSPFLRSKHRSATHLKQAKTTEELELEKVEKAKKEAAALRRRNARTVGPALQGRTAAAPRPAPKRPPTEPIVTKEFNLRTAKRQRLHGMETRHQNPSGNASSSAAAPSPWKSTAQRVAEFTTGVSTRQNNQRQRPVPRGARQQQQQRGRAELTVPRTPRFATKTRARASRFKPTEEEEAAKAVAEVQAIKVRQRKETERANNAVLPARRRSERKPLTEFKPFSFATDVRAAQRSTKPAAELPSFVFGAQDNGPVTRSRAHVVTTAAPIGAPSAWASTAPRSSAHRELTSLQQHQQYQQQREEDEHYQQRPGSGTTSSEGFDLGAGGPVETRARRRTTAGPVVLGKLGGAVRVLRKEQDEEEERSDDEECCTEEQDGMQAIIRAGATAGTDRTTLHNPLFHA